MREQAVAQAVAQARRGSALLERLAGARKAGRQSSFEKRHRHEWQLEAKRLAREARALERELRAEGAPGPERQPRGAKAKVRQPLGLALRVEAEDAARDRRAFRDDLRAQVLGLREVLAAARDDARSRPGEDLQQLTELLMSVRHGFDLVGDELYEAAAALTQDVLEAKHRVQAAMREAKQATASGPDLSAPPADVVASLALRSVADGYDTCPGVLQAVEEGEGSLHALLDKFAAELDTIASAKAALATKLARERARGDLLDSLERERFVKLHREIVQRGRGLAAFFERASLEFPQRTRATLEAELAALEAERQARQQRKDCLARRAREFAATHAAALAGVARAADAADRERVAAAERGALDQAREELRQRLAVQRAAAEEQMAVLEEERREREAREREEQERQAELAELERERKRALVAEFQRKRDFLAAVEALHNAQHQAEVEAIRRELAPINQERVAFREGERLERLEEERQRAAAEEVARRQAALRLDKIRASVPYRYKLDELKPSRERLEQATFSSAVVPDAAYHNYNREGLFRNPGFTSDQVCSDVRFRVVEALRSRGLHHSSHAHALLRSMAAPHLASKNLTSSLG